MTKHTPGPWSVGYQGLNAWEIESDDRNSLASVIALGEEMSPEDKANAHLIAAAPDLLSVVVELSRLKLGKGGYCSMPLRELVERATAAIAVAVQE